MHVYIYIYIHQLITENYKIEIMINKHKVSLQQQAIKSTKNDRQKKNTNSQVAVKETLILSALSKPWRPFQ